MTRLLTFPRGPIDDFRMLLAKILPVLELHLQLEHDANVLNISKANTALLSRASDMTY